MYLKIIPLVGEFLAIESRATVDLPKPEKRFDYYRVLSVAHIMYQTKHRKGEILEGKSEATILVKYLGNEKLRS